MTRRTVALTGIPGVGKSTLLTSLSTRLDFVPLQASALIRKGREQALGEMVTHDWLRYANLEESQQLLIRGFDASATQAMPLSYWTAIRSSSGITTTFRLMPLFSGQSASMR